MHHAQANFRLARRLRGERRSITPDMSFRVIASFVHAFHLPALKPARPRGRGLVRASLRPVPSNRNACDRFRFFSTFDGEDSHAYRNP